MKRSDVERVLEKTREFWEDHLYKLVSLVDLYAIADQIWREMLLENMEEKPRVEMSVTKSELHTLERSGDLICDGESCDVHLVFVDDSDSVMVTESGKIVIFGEEIHDDDE
jgi:hypothetical protein